MRARRQRIRKIVFSCLILLFVCGGFPVLFFSSSEGAEDRDIVVDYAMLGMKEKSRLPVSSSIDTQASSAPGFQQAAVADISSATDISGQEVTPDSNLVAVTRESALNPESDLGTQIDTSGSSVGNEADIGIEASVYGIGAGDDVGSDSADGISSVVESAASNPAPEGGGGGSDPPAPEPPPPEEEFF